MGRDRAQVPLEFASPESPLLRQCGPQLVFPGQATPTLECGCLGTRRTEEEMRCYRYTSAQQEPQRLWGCRMPGTPQFITPHGVSSTGAADFVRLREAK